jgi:hypothetical protein
MLNGKEFDIQEGKNYLIYMVLFSLLQTVDAHLRNRVSLMNKYSVKRLILERLVIYFFILKGLL